MSLEKPKLPDGAIEICKSFDKDRNGFISKKEIIQSIGKDTLSKKELDEMMKKADTNHDGKVDYNEFFATFFNKD